MQTDSGIYLCQNCHQKYVFELQTSAQVNASFLCPDCQRTEALLAKTSNPETLAWINYWPV
jgi:transcription initiation factor IIE alpha subunit